MQQLDKIKTKYLGDGYGLTVSADIEALREAANRALEDATNLVYSQKVREKRTAAGLADFSDPEYEKRTKARGLERIKEPEINLVLKKNVV